jgi:hypothetical protein
MIERDVDTTIKGIISRTPAQTSRVIRWGNGWYKIVNTNSQLPFDVISASTADGTDIQQWTDNGTEAQRF